jgi:hypothetical protein
MPCEDSGAKTLSIHRILNQNCPPLITHSLGPRQESQVGLARHHFNANEIAFPHIRLGFEQIFKNQLSGRDQPPGYLSNHLSEFG